MSVALANQYIDDVLSGRIKPCKWIRLACKRHRDDLSKQADPAYPYAFDPSKAEKVCKFLQLLPHTKAKWAAQKLKLKLEPWQAFLIVCTFGWIVKATGLRRFTNVMYVIPRKNGKSLLAAGIGLYMLCADGEYGPEVYCGATSEKQAWEVFRPAKQMVERTPALQSNKQWTIGINAKNLNIVANGGKFEPVIGKPGDGASPHCAILDECHEIPDSVIRDTMRTGMGAREQPMLLQITTAGINISSPCYDDILEGRKMLEGSIDAPDMFFAEWTIDEDVKWDSIEAIRMANPNLGVSVGEDFLQARLSEATRNPRNQNAFKIKHLNVWTSSKSAFYNMHSWNKCYSYITEEDGTDRAVTMEDFKEFPCWIGMDLASYQDIAAVCYVFKLDDGELAVFGQFFLPEKIAEDAGNDHYAGWANAGKIITTQGNMISHEAIVDEILNVRDQGFDIRQILFDTTQANQMMASLVSEGFALERFKQWAANYSEPMKRSAALMDEGKLIHPWTENDPMSWMISNVVSRPNKKEEEYPDKERSELKIDGPIAMLMAIAGVINGDETTSVYESRELLVF